MICSEEPWCEQTLTFHVAISIEILKLLIIINDQSEFSFGGGGNFHIQKYISPIMTGCKFRGQNSPY